jgi:hypothetical protein
MSSVPAVLATTRFVVDNARFVLIDHARIAAVADELAMHPSAPATFDCSRHPCGPEPGVANVVLVLDTLNFCFWPEPGQPRWRVTWQGETTDGYWALVAAVRRGLAEGVPLTDATYLAQVTDAQVAHLLRGEGTIPLLAERANALRETGRVLQERYGGQFTNAIAQAGREAPRLVALLGSEFSSFADVATYGGQPVELYKRAQICCSDLDGASQGAAWGKLSGLDQLTAFADYKVPQVLRQLGILTYTEALAQTIAAQRPLPPGSEAEVEIRAATIWAVEYLRRALATRGVALRAFELDWHLWELGQRLPPGTEPYHRTRTIYY